MSDTSKLCMKCMLPGLGEDGICTKCKADEKSLWGAPHHLRPRTMLNGRYIVGRVIGEGGFGISYVGWDATLSIKVAIKEYYPAGFASRDSSTDTSVHSFSGDKGDFYAEGCNRFIEEAQRLARFFGMPGIVSVKDFFKENGTAYIVMEFVEGSTMRIILESMGNKLPEAHVMEMMKPLVISLANMHNQGVIHRDIAPDNIMVQPDGTVKLLDFGAARDMVTDGKSTAAVMKHGYAPEEQYDTNRQRQGPWTDVYALCATIFRAIEGVTPPDAIARLRADEFRGFNQPVSENTRSVIMKGLALAPENRWQNIEQLAKALYPNTSTEQMRSAAPSPPPVSLPPATHEAAAKPTLLAGKNKPAMLAAAAVIVLFIIAGGFFIFGGGSDGDAAPAHFADAPYAGFDTGAGEQQETPAATERRDAYGRQVATEFMGNFTAMFLDGDEVHTYVMNLLGLDRNAPGSGILAHLYDLRDATTWQLDPVHIPSELAADMSFSDDLGVRALQFWMWDINGDGIPLIGINSYFWLESGFDTSMEVFKYSDGGYSRIGELGFLFPGLTASGLYRDANGRLLMVQSCPKDIGLPEVFYVTITSYTIHSQSMNPQPWERLGTDFHSLIWDWENYLVPGLPFSELTPVPRMDDLREEIRANRAPVARAQFEASFAVMEELRRQAEATRQAHGEPDNIELPPPRLDVQTGQTIRFGGRNWIVLDVRGNYAKILHETNIMYQPYHDVPGDVTWATSFARSWLNWEFYYSLPPADRDRIRETYVVTNSNPWDFTFYDGWVNTPGGNNTVDKIFLLSLWEVVDHFGDSGQLENQIHPANDWWGFHDRYSDARIALNDEGSATWWWLRSPGYAPSRAAVVRNDGRLYVLGFRVNTSSGVGGLRPALWLRLE